MRRRPGALRRARLDKRADPLELLGRPCAGEGAAVLKEGDALMAVTSERCGTINRCPNGYKSPLP
jgi:hypothetical protein